MNSKKSTYIEGWEKAIAKKNAKLTLEQEKEVLRAFNGSMNDLIKKIANAKNGYLPLKIYKDFAYDLYVQLDGIVHSYSKEAVSSTLDAQAMMIIKLLGEDGQATAGLYSNKIRMASSVYSRQAAENLAKGGIYKDGMGLSSRIWKVSNQAGNTLQSVVAQGVTSGQSATEMAKLLEEYVNPNARRFWDNEKIESILGKATARKFQTLEYNSLRLARTTISHSATAGVKQWGKVNPYARKVQWHSVHSPGRTCDICLELDGQIFTIEECPFDHPNGMCYQTVYYDQSLEQIADELADWVNGAENEKLDSWYADLNIEF